MKIPISLRYLIHQSERYSPIVLIQGNMQTGKSTMLKVFSDIISQEKFKIDWDYKKYCAKSFDELIEYVDKYDDSIIAIEEAGFQLSAMEWYSKSNNLFDKIMQTQAYKHNIYFIVLPHSLGVAKAHRRLVDMTFIVKRKIENKRRTLIYPVIFRKIYWRLDETGYKPVFLPQIIVKLNQEQLDKAKEFTNWLIEFKKDIMKDIKAEWNNPKNHRCDFTGCRNKNIVFLNGGWICQEHLHGNV